MKNKITIIIVLIVAVVLFFVYQNNSNKFGDFAYEYGFSDELTFNLPYEDADAKGSLGDYYIKPKDSDSFPTIYIGRVTTESAEARDSQELLNLARESNNIYCPDSKDCSEIEDSSSHTINSLDAVSFVVKYDEDTSLDLSKYHPDMGATVEQHSRNEYHYYFQNFEETSDIYDSSEGALIYRFWINLPSQMSEKDAKSFLDQVMKTVEFI